MEPTQTVYDLAEQVAQQGTYSELSQPIQVALFLGAMTLLSAGLVTMTAFTRIIIVLSFVRRALTTQELPPKQVIIGLSFFLTLFVMSPTIEVINRDALVPLVNKEISAVDAWKNSEVALREFMLRQVRKQDLMLFMDLAEIGQVESAAEIPMRVLVPSFVISELKTAFIMGFCIYIPFLLVDFVVSTVLMSLGMMMMPPVIISTPFKILLFVLVDGWRLVIHSLSLSFN